MISGPYTSGARSDADRQRNLDVMNEAAVEVFRRGHVPIIGVNMALPMIAVAGAQCFDELMMPVSLALTERCDAVLRVGGPSKGADDEVERFRARGALVLTRVEDVPDEAERRTAGEATGRKDEGPVAR
ncbi:DUF4406 domain-containing protein [Sandaracinus amylolyticus]|nr:DUF4406 domain-containing protein [Sandaracinus amylolyticus]